MLLDEAPVVGVIGPSPDRPDGPFWEGLAAGELRLPRCGGCRRWGWPPEWICSRCHAGTREWEVVEARGRVYSWTRTWHPFTPELADRVPYLVVLVELPDAGGCRLLGILVGDDGAEVRIGDPVAGVIQPPGLATGGVAVLRWKRA